MEDYLNNEERKDASKGFFDDIEVLCFPRVFLSREFNHSSSSSLLLEKFIK